MTDHLSPGIVRDDAVQPRYCGICGAVMVQRGNAWVCPMQKAEPTCITDERRQRIRATIAHRVPGAPF